MCRIGAFISFAFGNKQRVVVVVIYGERVFVNCYLQTVANLNVRGVIGVFYSKFRFLRSHAPFRIVVTLEQLQNFNLYYNRSSTNEDPFSSDQSSTQSGSSISNFGNEILAHTTTGLEFNPLRGFYFRGGYSFRRRNEIKIVDKPAMVGFSWGFGLKIRRLMFNYARSTYHISGASNILSVSIDIAAKS